MKCYFYGEIKKLAEVLKKTDTNRNNNKKKY